MFTCPACREQTISFKSKYLAGLWQPIHCRQCGAKLTAYPWLLLCLHMVYLWNVLWFSGLYVLDGHDPLNFAYMAVAWGVLDFLNVQLIPLAIMRRHPG